MPKRDRVTVVADVDDVGYLVEVLTDRADRARAVRKLLLRAIAAVKKGK